MAQEARLTRRMLGVLEARLPETRLEQVKDPRSVRGRRWRLEVLLRVVLVAMVAGCKSLAQLEAYTEAHNLPRHPLVEDGYPSIGCMPCTRRIQAGEDYRAGRWAGSDKDECGIHLTDGGGIWSGRVIRWLQLPMAKRGWNSSTPEVSNWCCSMY